MRDGNHYNFTGVYKTNTHYKFIKDVYYINKFEV